MPSNSRQTILQFLSILRTKSTPLLFSWHFESEWGRIIGVIYNHPTFTNGVIVRQQSRLRSVFHKKTIVGTLNLDTYLSLPIFEQPSGCCGFKERKGNQPTAAATEKVWTQTYVRWSLKKWCSCSMVRIFAIQVQGQCCQYNKEKPQPHNRVWQAGKSKDTPHDESRSLTAQWVPVKDWLRVWRRGNKT